MKLIAIKSKLNNQGKKLRKDKRLKQMSNRKDSQ
jgi:hypothetical protein